jgi:hypothetical protein
MQAALMRRALLLGSLALSLWGAAIAAENETGLEFAGVLGGGKDIRIALTRKSGGVTQWVAVGSRYAGYHVSGYDANADVVVLEKDGRTFRLALRQGKPAGAGVKHTPEIERAILNNLRQLAAAADQFYLENGKNSTSYEELVGPTKYVKSISPLNGENYRAIQFAQGKVITVTTASGHSVSYSP